ncbi:MAG: hypothetical protein NC191_05455 [Muribaculaceae bacterium]|nr:hypothetical protein [Muribaculaceae bacterium]
MQNQMGGVIPPQFQQGISSQTVSPQQAPQMGYNDMIYQQEQAIGADVQRVKDMVNQGAISEAQGKVLLLQLARKAQQINTFRNSVHPEAVAQNSFAPAPGFLNTPTPMDLFNQEHPGFFDGDGRVEVLNYIKGLGMDKDEILQIAKMVENLENSAVDRYLKKSAYEKTLNDENAAAKSKLTSYAQNTSSDGNMVKAFTREDIGNMSGDEFTQNEKAIFEQLRQGLIK